MLPTPNPGDRPSHLELDRLATGELSPTERAALEARLTRASHDHLAEAREASAPPLDLAAVRARASTLHAAAAEPPANRPWAWLSALAVAAAALLVLVPLALTPEPEWDGLRGGGGLDLFEVRGGSAVPYDGAPLAAGAALGLQVHRGGHDGVVVLSVDGAGEVSVYWPESGTAPRPLSEPSARLGTVVLDDAPGPEVFFAVYDTSVPAARAAARAAWEQGGVVGLRAWAESGAVERVEVPRR
ncbi:MAG: hypothetical protein ACI8PZ_002971 [Myxococcota bacterium]|jgi:hypothetical protein